MHRAARTGQHEQRDEMKRDLHRLGLASRRGLCVFSGGRFVSAFRV